MGCGGVSVQSSQQSGYVSVVVTNLNGGSAFAGCWFGGVTQLKMEAVGLGYDDCFVGQMYTFDYGRMSAIGSQGSATAITQGDTPERLCVNAEAGMQD